MIIWKNQRQELPKRRRFPLFATGNLTGNLYLVVGMLNADKCECVCMATGVNNNFKRYVGQRSIEYREYLSILPAGFEITFIQEPRP